MNTDNMTRFLLQVSEAHRDDFIVMVVDGASSHRCKELMVPENVGKRSITADTALRLGKYFGASPEIWLNLQADYDMRVVCRTTWPSIEPRVRVRAA